jgi:hypothetical protein
VLTAHVDLFSPEPGRPGAVAEDVRRALETAGYRVEVTRRPEDSDGEFAQLAVSRGEQSMLLDLARDWRQQPPVHLDIGPVLHLDDAVGSKVTAMVGRGLPRDFIDVAAALDHYNRNGAPPQDPPARRPCTTSVTRALHRADGVVGRAHTRSGMRASSR